MDRGKFNIILILNHEQGGQEKAFVVGKYIYSAVVNQNFRVLLDLPKVINHYEQNGHPLCGVVWCGVAIRVVLSRWFRFGLGLVPGFFGVGVQNFPAMPAQGRRLGATTKPPRRASADWNLTQNHPETRGAHWYNSSTSGIIGPLG